MKIIIEKEQDGHWTVETEDKSSGSLGYEEMIGLLVALTMPENRPSLQYLKTAEQHAAWEEYKKQNWNKPKDKDALLNAFINDSLIIDDAEFEQPAAPEVTFINGGVAEDVSVSTHDSKPLKVVIHDIVRVEDEPKRISTISKLAQQIEAIMNDPERTVDGNIEAITFILNYRFVCVLNLMLNIHETSTNENDKCQRLMDLAKVYGLKKTMVGTFY